MLAGGRKRVVKGGCGCQFTRREGMEEVEQTHIFFGELAEGEGAE